MRAIWLGLIGFVVIATGVAVWWLNADVSLPAGEDVTGRPTTSLSETGFERTTDEEESFDAGVGRVTGLVLDENGDPAADAVVRLYAERLDVESLSCGRCHESVLDCGDPSTATKLLAGIRAGQFKASPALAETRTDAEGRFTFEQAPLDATLVASRGRLSGEGSAYDEPVELMLQAPVSVELHVTDEEGVAVPGARVTLFSPREGTVDERPVDAEGRLTLSSGDPHAWLAVEAPGFLPAGRRAESVDAIVLSRPKTLIVRTKLAGAPVDAVVRVTAHGEPMDLRTQRGELRLEQLPAGYVSVAVQAGELTAPESGAELMDAETVLEFELRKGGRLLVTVTDELGQPLELVDASLSSAETSFPTTVEGGAMLVLGPVPEGEYELSIDAEGRIPFNRRLDLKPGDTSLEVIMREAPRVKGVVLNTAGKPVPGARVFAWEGGELLGGAASDETGAFELALRLPGEVTLKVEEEQTGTAEQNVTVPGGPYTIKLSERGILEVELFDFDGTPLTVNLSLHSEKTGEVRWIDPDGTGPGRAAGLQGGTWTVERMNPGRVPLSKKVEIVEGQVTKLSLRLEKGVSITGKVVDHEGRAVGEAMVTMVGRSELVNTDEQGRFEWSGVQEGPCELMAVLPGGSDSPKVKVTAPASDVVLTLPKPARVSGRVVDEQGRPVTEFEANATPVKAADGRFEVSAPMKTLDVFVMGFAAIYLSEVEGDVGDVVLKKQPMIEGVVLDPEGKPVSGAQVMSRSEMTPVVTDAAGRFKVMVSDDEEAELVAMRGLLSGMTRARAGASARIVMKRGTTVSGKVVDAKGRGVATSVTATSVASQNPVEVESDVTGRFQLELAAGVWRLSTRFNRVQRAIEVGSEPLEITLGEESGSCGLVLRSSVPIDSVWLFASAKDATDDPWGAAEVTPGTIEVPVANPAPEVSARGLPCGRYALVASLGGGVASSQVDLRSPSEQLTIDAPEEPSVEKEAVP